LAPDRSSEREPAVSLRDKSNVVVVWLPALTFAQINWDIMNLFVIIVLGVLEMVALVVVIRLWLRRRLRLLPRIFWSIVLLIPLVGLLTYGFVMSNLEKNPDKMETTADSDAFYGGGGHF